MLIKLRPIIIIFSLLIFWQGLVMILRLPSYILPTPIAVFKTMVLQWPLLLSQTWPTLLETLLGLFFGVAVGMLGALAMAYFQPVRFWLLPVLVISQALPTFAIAPLLVIWFGYGMASKIITTMIMLFFPVTSAFFDGLRRTETGWLDLARTMNATRWRELWHLRFPAALPALASGLRIATATAPIGAVIGEWVGSSRGLGFLMLNANARLQIDLMFAALLIIVLMALILYGMMDFSLRKIINWQPE